MALLLVLVVVGLVILTFRIFEPFLLALLWGAVLVTVTHDAHESLARALGGRRTLASALMTVAVAALVLAPFVFVAFVFVGDAVEIARSAAALQSDERIAEIESHRAVRWALTWVRDTLGREVDLRELAATVQASIEATIVRAATDVGAFFLRLFATLFFIVLSTFYFFRDGRDLVRIGRELMPLHDEDRAAILGDVRAAILASVRGGLLTALAQGILGFVILFVLGNDQPVLWAAMMAVASLIPVVGTSIVWLPMALLLLVEEQTAKALVLAGYGVVVIGMADNFLRPVLVGRHMEAHPLMLFFGILGGIAAFGFAGVVLGPVSVAFLGVTMRLFRREFRRVEA